MLVSVENPWTGHFKEHRLVTLVQELIEDKVFYLYHTDSCAAATEALGRAAAVTEAGGLAGGVFSKKPSALLLAGVDSKETMPICQKAACRTVIPGTSIHACMGDPERKQKEKGLAWARQPVAPQCQDQGEGPCCPQHWHSR